MIENIHSRLAPFLRQFVKKCSVSSFESFSEVSLLPLCTILFIPQPHPSVQIQTKALIDAKRWGTFCIAPIPAALLVHPSSCDHAGRCALKNSEKEKKMLNFVSLKIALKHEIWHTVVLHFHWREVERDKFTHGHSGPAKSPGKINGRACSWSGTCAKKALIRWMLGTWSIHLKPFVNASLVVDAEAGQACDGVPLC